MKEDLFSKLNIKNYNNELEKILEAKDFSKDVKNLLLSMLYKVETSYHDYAKIKRNVENKNEFIEQILNNIKICKKIKLVKPTNDKAEELEKNKKTFKINKEEKEIEIFPNEKSLLYAIYYLGNEKMYLNEKYDYIRIAFPTMLNEGKDNNKVEIIRDFNAWSWNNNADEITNVTCNLIYQNLLILLGYEKLNGWMENKNYEDKVEILENDFCALYGQEKTKKMLNLIYKISISICAKRNIKEKERLEDEFNYIKKEYEDIKNKKEYLSKLSEKKKQQLEIIGQIDTVLKDEEKLLDAYEERNSKLPLYNKMMNVEHFKQILNKERKKALKVIEECNQNMEPKKYVEQKEKLKNEFELLEYINKDANKEVEEVEKIFMQCLQEKIEKAENKKEIIELIYMLRYYYFVPFSDKEYIKDKKSLRKVLEETTKVLIQKMYKYKMINKIFVQNETNQKIISKIFETRIMDLETLEIEALKQENIIKVNIYDKEDFEKSFEIPFDEKYKIKFGKKIKLFN